MYSISGKDKSYSKLHIRFKFILNFMEASIKILKSNQIEIEYNEKKLYSTIHDLKFYNFKIRSTFESKV